MDFVYKLIVWYEDNIVGKRTYIVAVITALITLLQQFNVITLTQSQLDAVYGFLAAIGLITLRSAINGK